MTTSSALGTPVFSAGGCCFTWVEVIEAARVRGDWAALQQHVAGLLMRESHLAAAGALPTADQTRAAANEFRYRHRLLSADELGEWLARRDISFDDWAAEMQRSLLDPAEPDPAAVPGANERVDWVHAVCSGKLADYALVFAQEVAVQLTEDPGSSLGGDMAALPRARANFCAAQLQESTLAAEIRNNTIGWTRVDLQMLIHSDEMVIREAALCVRIDGRELADVAAAAGAPLHEMSVLVDDVEPALRSRLLAAEPGELIGPFATATGHQLGLVQRRTPPSLGDAAQRRRAEETVITRALVSAVNRNVTWHEHF